MNKIKDNFIPIDEATNPIISNHAAMFGDSISFLVHDLPITLYYNGLTTQSNASVLLTCKSISLLVTLDIGRVTDENIDFTQFVVHFITKSYAFSRIPTGASKREGKSSERDILLSRLIDRSIRPIINSRLKNPVQMICTLLSHHTPASENDNSDIHLDLDFLSVLAATAALTLSSVPVLGMPIGCRVAMNPVSNQLIFCPYIKEIAKSPLDLFITFCNDEVIMIECESKELSRETLVNAVSFARMEAKFIEEFIRSLEPHAKEKITLVESIHDYDSILKDNVAKEITALLNIIHKKERNEGFRLLEETLVKDLLKANPEFEKNKISKAFHSLKKNLMREKIFNTQKRIDDRDPSTIRPLSMMIDVPFMSSSHGSALFKRGNTAALVSVVLGTAYDEQMIEGFESDKKERFILHYNFPPYAVGEAGQLKTPNRREIGHAKLAAKALRNLVPDKKNFPYTIRISSEIIACDGSSSMATICGASLAMMDAGIQLKAPVAGIAIGVVVKSRDSNECIILTDILGDEDHLGDMDFKVAGTKNGITALQMDVKDFGIKDDKTLGDILDAGITGFNFILDEMLETISSHRGDMKKNAPSIIQMAVEKNQIRAVIGNRGDTIKTICEVSGARIDVDSNTGLISIFGSSRKSVEKAQEIINDLILQPEVGKTYEGSVEKVTDFGIFVNFLGGKVRGLVHERNCEGDKYAFYNKKKSLKMGDFLMVKVVFISSDGKIGLSIVENVNSDSQVASKDNQNEPEIQEEAEELIDAIESNEDSNNELIKDSDIIENKKDKTMNNEKELDKEEDKDKDKAKHKCTFF